MIGCRRPGAGLSHTGAGCRSALRRRKARPRAGPAGAGRGGKGRDGWNAGQVARVLMERGVEILRLEYSYSLFLHFFSNHSVFSCPTNPRPTWGRVV